MTTNLLSIGKTGLLAAQVGLSTTGHNITNANVAGYTRQSVGQAASTAQYASFGYTGTGTEVAQVKRVYDQFLTTEVRSAQAATSALDTYGTQISQIDNLLADPTAGLSPALQDFFKAVQDVSANPASTASREALLSNSSALAGRFQSLSARMTEIGDGVNAGIVAKVSEINSYARQIGDINDAITRLSDGGKVQPSDLLDQRDQMIGELNKLVKTSVAEGADGRVIVSIGSGQPIVAGSQAFELSAIGSPTDPTRMTIGYQAGAKIAQLPDSVLSGGSLGGLLDFRSGTLDRVQNSLGRVALSLALSVNDQNKLGQDLNGAPGGDFFNVAPAGVIADQRNNPTSDIHVGAVVTDPSALTTSDYSVEFVGDPAAGGAFFVSRQPDGARVEITGTPQVVDGVEYRITSAAGGAPLAADGDNFLVRPTAFGATGFEVALSDRSKIAAAAPLRAGVPPPPPTANTGDAKISAVSIDKNYVRSADPSIPDPVPLPVTVTYAAGPPGTLNMGIDPPIPVLVNGAAGGTSDAIDYKAGDVLTFGGISITMTGAPGDGDRFSVEQNLNGVGDNRNAVLLGKLQTANILDGSAATFQGAYAETVGLVGNKTREVQLNGAASTSLLAQNEAAQQSMSGVNLDEEAANLLRYQQAYQACGKAMQVASQLFDVVLGLGR